MRREAVAAVRWIFDLGVTCETGRLAPWQDLREDWRRMLEDIAVIRTEESYGSF